MPLSRRSLLALGVLGPAVGLTSCRDSTRPETAPPSTATPPPCEPGRWPGHQPGLIRLGCTSQPLRATTDLVGDVGLHRTFHPWPWQERERRSITRSHAAGILPWVSFKPPAGAASWEAVAAGDHDGELRRRAQGYAAFDRPIVVTFHHEPADEGPGRADVWAAAWCRTHDVMTDAADLSHVAFAPIIGEWSFNPRNREVAPNTWVQTSVLDRSAFFGLDVYQNLSGQGLEPRIGRIVAELERAGHGDIMLGIGEIGATDGFGTRSAAEWWTEQWAWLESRPDRIGVISYYNSAENTQPGLDWTLGESPEKLRAVQRSFESAVLARTPVAFCPAA